MFVHHIMQTVPPLHPPFLLFGVISGLLFDAVATFSRKSYRHLAAVSVYWGFHRCRPQRRICAHRCQSLTELYSLTNEAGVRRKGGKQYGHSATESHLANELGLTSMFITKSPNRALVSSPPRNSFTRLLRVQSIMAILSYPRTRSAAVRTILSTLSLTTVSIAVQKFAA